MRNRHFYTVGTVLAVCGALPAMAATQVFFTDFESGLPSQFSGAGGVVGTQDFDTAVPAVGLSFLRNDTAGNPASSTILTLNALPSHTSLDIGFLLATIDSWDGNDSFYGHDRFEVLVDGTSVFDYSFTSPSLSFLPDIPTSDAIGSGSLGFNSGWLDAVYDFTAFNDLLNIPHTDSSAVIEFRAYGAGWQAGDDESWAIDNVRVAVDGGVTPVPEVGTTVSATAFGLACVAGWLRRRKASTNG
jgi:hypothetical protein